MICAVEYGTEVWQEQEGAVRLEYAGAVMEEICIAAAEGFNRLSHGGVEIGGVLFGIGDAGSIRVLAHKALECEHAFGPSFTLSHNDTKALEDLLADAENNSELAGMRAVGWYHSHTRSDISLTEKDLQLFQRYFPETWQIALVLRPNRFEPVRAGLFFRDSNGTVHEDSTRRQFVVHPTGGKPLAPESALAATEPAPLLNTEHPPHSPQESESRQEVRELVTTFPTAGVAARSRWPWRSASILLLSAAVTYWIASSPPAAGLSLRALDTDGQLRIDWRWEDRAIQDSASGELEIEDGSARVENELSAEQLRAGSVTYERNTGNVLIRLTVHGANHSIRSETARFLGSPVARKTRIAANTADRIVDPPAGDLRNGGARLQKSEKEIRAEEPPRQPARPIAREHAKVETPMPAPAMAPQPARQLIIPAARVARSLDLAPPPVPAMASNMIPALPDLIPRLPPPHPPKPAYRGPLDGRIIWTGKLQHRGTIEILGAVASQGHITSGLPGVPVRVQVFPGELSGGGLRLFTANSGSTGETEAPGAQNGWNRTTYVLSPPQAETIHLIEGPGSQNAWRGLRLRAERGEHSIIVLKWQIMAGDEPTQEISDR